MGEFAIRPLRVGAEVVDLAAGTEEDPEVRRALYDAWLTHGVLLFRNVDSIDRHLAISRCFGDLEIHPVPEVRHADNPYLIELGAPEKGAVNKPVAWVFDDGDIRINRIAWHRDTAYTPDICKGAMLRMVEVPEHEGETLLADTAMAWDALPEEVQQQLERLEYRATIRTDHLNTLGRNGVFWKSARLATEEEAPGNNARYARISGIDGRYPSVIHPAVLAHPESGRKCIFLSPTYVDCFLGMDPSDSDELLDYLSRHMLQSGFVLRHKWKPDDAIVWDNRRFMHAGMGNLPDEPRYGLRTTLAGPLRTGRYAGESPGP